MKTRSQSSLYAAFESHGQGHVFQYVDQLSALQRENLERQAATIDLLQLDEIIKTHITLKSKTSPHQIPESKIQPPKFISLSESQDKAEEAESIGEDAIASGKVALFTVAGGQGTRLGFPKPKGMFPITPLCKKNLFQLFAEKIKFAEKKYQTSLVWFIMTSQFTHDDTLRYFEKNNNLGLDNVVFVQQGQMPAVDSNGKIILKSKDSIFFSPDGHGGFFDVLLKDNISSIMEEHGVELLSYFQVDNPLVKCIDPRFVGLHLINASQMSSKMIRKRHPKEKVGVFCEVDRKLSLIEYCNLPKKLAEKESPEGQIVFNAANPAIHLINRDFARKIAQDKDLPFHAATKEVLIDLDQNPQTIKAIKFEKFVFDALPFAKNPILFEVDRKDEFSPIKNAEGDDSPQSTQKALLRRYAAWLSHAGVSIPTDHEGIPQLSIEISPLFANSKKEFKLKWNALKVKPEIKEGLYIE